MTGQNQRVMNDHDDDDADGGRDGSGYISDQALLFE